MLQSLCFVFTRECPIEDISKRLCMVALCTMHVKYLHKVYLDFFVLIGRILTCTKIVAIPASLNPDLIMQHWL